jgi:hypothetical protein
MQLAGPINAQVPTLDVTSGCRAAATAGLSADESYKTCMDDELSARNELVRDWSTFAADDRGRCTAEASGPGSPSYVDLLVCLQMSRDARQLQMQGGGKQQ